MKKNEIKEEIKTLLGKLKNKSAFADKVAPLVGRSAKTIYRHWFFKSTMSPGLPDDIGKLRIIRRELKKELEKVTA